MNIKKTIGKTEHGHVFICSTCQMIHFEFKNLNYNFRDEEDYLHFADYFLRLDGKFWESTNEDIFFKRKIIVPGGFSDFNILLNLEELMELKALFSGSICEERSPVRASYTFFHNN
ncbi:MAG: DUF6686 family protein, partial [Bacteroidota bacterium]